MPSKAEKLIDARIDRAYRAACSGVAINIMDIPKVFAFGKIKIAEGEDDQALASSIGHYVRSIAVKVAVLAILLANIPTAHAAEDKTVDGVAGSYVHFTDGTTYKADDDISDWNKGDDVIVTDDNVLINRSRGDEEVAADEQ